MASDSIVERRFEAFAKEASLKVFLPRYSDIHDLPPDGVDVLDALSQHTSRKKVFFDERCWVIIALNAHVDKAETERLIPSLEVNLSAHVTDAAHVGSGKAASIPTKQETASTTLMGRSARLVQASRTGTVVLWDAEILLKRPRTRLEKPSVRFMASIKLTEAALTSARKAQVDVLKSYEPLPRNVLEPLQSDPSFQGLDVHFTETRLTEVTPLTATSRADVGFIRGGSAQNFPFVQASFTRLNHSTLPDSVVASVCFAALSNGPASVVIANVQLEAPNAHIEDLSRLILPHQTRAGDETVFLQRLTRVSTAPEAEKSTVTVRIEAKAVTDDGDVPLDIRFQSSLTLSTSVQPTLTCSWRASDGADRQDQPVVVDTKPRPATHEGTKSSTNNDERTEFNFTAPATTACDEEFHVTVLCINRSGRPRQFSLLAVRSSELDDQTSRAAVPGRRYLAAALLLDPEKRIGPISNGASYETTVRYRALSSGVLNLGIIRILDLESQLTVNVEHLPDVIAVDPAGTNG